MLVAQNNLRLFKHFWNSNMATFYLSGCPKSTSQNIHGNNASGWAQPFSYQGISGIDQRLHYIRGCEWEKKLNCSWFEALKYMILAKIAFRPSKHCWHRSTAWSHRPCLYRAAPKLLMVRNVSDRSSPKIIFCSILSLSALVSTLIVAALVIERAIPTVHGVKCGWIILTEDWLSCFVNSFHIL